MCLSNDHWKCRKEALEKLERLDQDAGELVFSSMRASLSDGNMRVRRAGAHALAEFCLPEVWGKKPASFGVEAVSELTRHLADPDLHVRRAAREPLRELQTKAFVGDVVVAGQSAIPYLQARLRDEDWQVRDATLRALGSLGPGALTLGRDIARLLADDSAVCRDAAKSTLDKLLGSGLAAADLQVVVPPNAELFVGRLKHKDPKVRCAAAWALGHSAAAVIGLHTIQDTLVTESDPAIFRVAVEALGWLGLAALPAAPELGLGLKTFLARPRSQEGATGNSDTSEDPNKVAMTESMFKVYQELLLVIGRALAREERLNEALNRAQHYASKLGRSTNVQREEGVISLMEPSLSHAAAVTEMLRILLDPTCPGAQAGMLSVHTAIDALEKFREAGLLGDFDMAKSGRDIVQSLQSCLKDSSWMVRLSAAEALAMLCCGLKPAVNCLRRHKRGDRPSLRIAASRLLVRMEDEKAHVHVKSAIDSATKLLRGILTGQSKQGEIPEKQQQFAQKVARAALTRLKNAGLVDESGHTHHHHHHHHHDEPAADEPKPSQHIRSEEQWGAVASRTVSGVRLRDGR